MTLTHYLPRLGLRDRSAPRHRAVDEVGRLRHQLAGAEIYMAGQRVQLVDVEAERDQARAHQAEAELLVVKLQADVDDLTIERDVLAEELAALRRRFAADIAVEANAYRIDVPCGIRDTSAIEDQATQPIPVRTLQQAHCIGPVLDPGRVA